MTDDQIKHMVERFLGWRLPENFRPDCGIHFDADAAKKLNPINHRYEPVGTNLFDYTQAETMVRHMVEGLALAGAPEAKEPDVSNVREAVATTRVAYVVQGAKGELVGVYTGSRDAEFAVFCNQASNAFIRLTILHDAAPSPTEGAKTVVEPEVVRRARREMTYGDDHHTATFSPKAVVDAYEAGLSAQRLPPELDDLVTAPPVDQPAQGEEA